MELLLTLENDDRAGEDRQRRLCDGRLSIGRGADSDWVLPDPARQLSKRHCVVERRGGARFLTDTSANGGFVADSPEPPPTGRPPPPPHQVALDLPRRRAPFDDVPDDAVPLPAPGPRVDERRP